jgi:asparagine synthase (glutamine-hydrolysing)
LGIFLSGGVDSSLLAALVARHSPLDAFTVGTHSKLDESEFATRVAKHLGLSLHVRFVTGDDFRSRFDDWCFFNDDPVADPSALALMLLSEHARDKGMKVMLAGEGADEVFGGYYSYLRYAAYSRLMGRNGGRRVSDVLRLAASGIDLDYLSFDGSPPFFGSAHVMWAHDRASLFVGETASLIPSWEAQAFAPRPRELDPSRYAMLCDQHVRLPNDLLPRTDRATMAFSLEARVPYLDRSVVEMANELNSRLCVRLLPPTGKWLLKRIAAKRVPRTAVYRRKRGFQLPVNDWLRNDFRERVEGFLDERAIGPLDYDYVGAVYRAHINGKDRAALLWAWLVLEQWHRLWIEGEAVPKQPSVVADRDAYQLLLAAHEGNLPAAGSRSAAQVTG